MNGRIKPILFPLYELFRRANVDATDKPYLQNLREVYIVSKPNDHPYGHETLYHAMKFFGCLSITNRLPSIERVGIDGLGEEYYESRRG